MDVQEGDERPGEEREREREKVRERERERERMREKEKERKRDNNKRGREDPIGYTLAKGNKGMEGLFFRNAFFSP